MSFDRYNGRRKKLELATIEVEVRPLSVKQFLRLLGLFQKLQDKLKFSQEDVEKLKLDAATIQTIATKVMDLCIGDQDEENPEKLGKNAQLVFDELGAVLRVEPNVLVEADLDDLVEVLVSFWEVNSNGPLGQRVRAITERFKPQIQDLGEVLEANFQVLLMRALPLGGTSDGGMTASSFPYTTSLDGASMTSSSSTSSESSTSLNPWDIDPELKQPTTPPATPSPMMEEAGTTELPTSAETQVQAE